MNEYIDLTYYQRNQDVISLSLSDSHSNSISI